MVAAAAPHKGTTALQEDSLRPLSPSEKPGNCQNPKDQRALVSPCETPNSSLPRGDYSPKKRTP